MFPEPRWDDPGGDVGGSGTEGLNRGPGPVSLAAGAAGLGRCLDSGMYEWD